MSMSRKVRDYFELVSPQWDVMRKNFYGEEVREAVLNAIHVSPSDTVLDVGAWNRVSNRGGCEDCAKVIALDFSRGMSEEAIAKMGSGNVEFRIGNVESMPLHDSSVDAVIGNMVLHHCPHPEIAMSEMSRVLKPGGRIAISDLQEHSHEWLRKEHADLWLGFRTEEVAAMMRKNGLDNVKVDALSSCCSSVQEEQQIKIPMFLASALKRNSRERKFVV